MKNEAIHIYPLNDLQEHVLHSLECDCKPIIEFVNNTALITHNSFDGREGIELANEVLAANVCYKTLKICRYDCGGLCKDGF